MGFYIKEYNFPRNLVKKSVQQLVKNLKACFTDRQSTERRRTAEPVIAEFLRQYCEENVGPV